MNILSLILAIGATFTLFGAITRAIMTGIELKKHTAQPGQKMKWSAVMFMCIALAVIFGGASYASSTLYNPSLSQNSSGASLLASNPTAHPTSLPTAIPITPQATICYYASCDGLLPEKYGCLGDRYLIGSHHIYIQDTKVAVVEFYVSKKCAAGWINIQTTSGMPGILSAEVNNGGYTQVYCYPSLPGGGSCSNGSSIELGGQPDRQNVHTSMLHTDLQYNLWGRGCFFSPNNSVNCFPAVSSSEHEFNGFWPPIAL